MAVHVWSVVRIVQLFAQYIRRDDETILKEMKEKLSETHQRSVVIYEFITIGVFYLSTHPMLTAAQKQNRVE